MLNDDQTKHLQKLCVTTFNNVAKLPGSQTTTWLKILETDLDEIRKHRDEDIKQSIDLLGDI